MKTKGKLYLSVAAAALAGAPMAGVAQQPPPGVTVGTNDLGGVVTSANGPEAGVWVIARDQGSADHVTPRSSSPTTRAAI